MNHDLHMYFLVTGHPNQTKAKPHFQKVVALLFVMLCKASNLS